MSVTVATSAANIGRTWSLGPVKIQLFDVSSVSGDTTCTVTGDRMGTVLFAMLASSVVQTSAPSYSGATATFTFTDPVATVKGQAFVIGI